MAPHKNRVLACATCGRYTKKMFGRFTGCIHAAFMLHAVVCGSVFHFREHTESIRIILYLVGEAVMMLSCMSVVVASWKDLKF